MKSLIGVVIEAVTCAAIYMAVTGNAGAANVVYLLAGLMAVCSFLVFCAGTKNLDVDTRPAWIRAFHTVMDWAQALTLAYFGFMWCAAAFTFGAAVGFEIRYGKRK